MATWYLLNAVVVSAAGVAQALPPGELIDDAQIASAAITAEGGVLWPSTDVTVAAAAVVVGTLRKGKGINSTDASFIMHAAAANSMLATASAAASTATALAATVAANAAIVAANATTAFKARALITTIGAYTINATTGVLTVTGNGALAAADGVTLAAGDPCFLPAGITNVSAKDTGPYIATSIGGASAQVVLTRPPWWVHGAAIPQGFDVAFGGEGTEFKGSSWRAMCGTAKVIGTDDPAFYPKTYRKKITLSSGTYTLGAGGGGEKLFLFDTTLSSVQLTSNTHAGTIGTSRLEAPSGSRIAGVAGTAAIVINSLVDAGTVAGSDSSTVDVQLTNY